MNSDARSSNSSGAAETARFIRRLARWGPWACLAVCGLLVLAAVLAWRQGDSAILAAGQMLTPIMANLMAAFTIKVMRPKMLRNADMWERMGEEQ